MVTVIIFLLHSVHEPSVCLLPNSDGYIPKLLYFLGGGFLLGCCSSVVLKHKHITHECKDKKTHLV